MAHHFWVFFFYTNKAVFKHNENVFFFFLFEKNIMRMQHCGFLFGVYCGFGVFFPLSVFV